MYGDASGTFVIADLSAMLERAEAERNIQTLGFKHTTLRSTEDGSVKELSGFDKAKGHTAPKFVSAGTKRWVSNLAEGDLKEEMEEYFGAVRNTKIYNSRRLEYDPPTEGGSAIRTPDFEFTVYYAQSEDNPAQYKVVRELTPLNNADLIEQDWFNSLFRRVFNEAVFEFSGHVNVVEIIERVERIEVFDVDYDGERSYCAITLEGFNGTIIITEGSLRYEFRNADTPKEMVLQLQKAHALLLGTPELQKALPL